MAWRHFSSLSEKLKIQSERISENEIIPGSFLKKYISYAKETIFPKLSFSACEILKEFYVSIRENAFEN